MSANVKTKPSRRTLRYNSYDDLLADLDALAGGKTESVGNWSLAQICKHLAVAFNGSIDGIAFRAPWPMRFVGKRLMKKRMLNKTLPSGFKIPKRVSKQLLPEDSAELQEQVAALREAVTRVKSDKSRAVHPFLDDLTTDEWDQFNLRHAELHMSFVHPVS